MCGVGGDEGRIYVIGRIHGWAGTLALSRFGGINERPVPLETLGTKASGIKEECYVNNVMILFFNHRKKQWMRLLPVTVV